jgi:TetR/AcrR family transcriptional repressor of lmrAB and yxaGH operons
MVERDTRSSRERMLQAAEALMREGGFKAAGIKQVVAQSGAPIGSVYHYFPQGKTQLAVEALRLHGGKGRILLDSMFAGDRPVPDRVRALFRTAARGFDRSDRNRGCAIGAVTLDLSAADSALRTVCQEAFDSWVVTIAGHLPWRSHKARRSFAQMVVTTLEGAFIVSRAEQIGQPFLTAGDWLAAAAESYGQRSRRK